MYEGKFVFEMRMCASHFLYFFAKFYREVFTPGRLFNKGKIALRNAGCVFVLSKMLEVGDLHLYNSSC